MSSNTILLEPRSKTLAHLFLLVLATVVFILASRSLGLDMEKFISRLSNAREVLGRMIVFDFSDIVLVIRELFVSIGIAITSLFLGLILSVILAFLAADNITPHRYISLIIKGLIATMRAIPGLVWILMVVASLGFSNTSGIVGMVISTLGYLTKTFTASIEDLGHESIEAMRSTGANWFQVICKGLMPNLTTTFLSWISIRLESSIAESINLGMLGIAGVGFLLIKAARSYEYGKIMVIVLVIYITMLLAEFGVNTLRARIDKMQP